jgi:hypothetical protein
MTVSAAKKLKKAKFNFKGRLGEGGRSVVQLLKAAGLKQYQIVKQLHSNRTSVHAAFHNIERSAGKKHLSPFAMKKALDIRAMKRMMRLNRFLSAAQLRAKLPRLGSRSRVWRLLRDMTWKSRVRPKRPSQLPSTTARRKKFVIRNATLDPTSIVCVDECRFDINDHGHVRMWVAPGEEPVPRDWDQYPLSVLIWGAIGIGFRQLVILPAGASRSAPFRLNAPQYVSLCLSTIVPHLQATGRKLVQDNASCHTAHSTAAYLSGESVELVEAWPPKSPDLNPIEKLWAIVKKRVATSSMPKTRAALVAAIEAGWAAVPQTVVDKVVRGIANRIEVVRAAGGAFV